MPANTDGVWTPEEAEAAFKAFGDLYQQIVALHRECGTVDATNEQAGERLQPYMAALSEETFWQLGQFLLALPDLANALLGLIEIESARRVFETLQVRTLRQEKARDN